MHSRHPVSPCQKPSLFYLLRLALLALGVVATTAACTRATPRHLNVDSFNKINLSSERDITFVVIGDNEGAGPVFKKVLKEISKHQEAKFVIHVGDLVSSGTEKEYAAALAQVRKYLTIPMLALPGDHDLTDGKDNTLWRQIFGEPYKAFRVGLYAFYFVDASTPEALDDTQLADLEKQMAAGSGKRLQFLFLHTPIYDPRPGGTGGLPPEKAEKLMRLLRNYRVQRIFAGNINGLFSGWWEGARYVITGGAGGPLAGKETPYYFYHYVVVHVYSNQVEIEVHNVTPPGTRKNKDDAHAVLKVQ